VEMTACGIHNGSFNRWLTKESPGGTPSGGRRGSRAVSPSGWKGRVTIGCCHDGIAEVSEKLRLVNARASSAAADAERPPSRGRCSAAGRNSADQAEIAYALYTDPPLGRSGMTEAEVRKTGKPALISTMATEDVSRAYEKGDR